MKKQSTRFLFGQLKIGYITKKWRSTRGSPSRAQNKVKTIEINQNLYSSRNKTSSKPTFLQELAYHVDYFRKERLLDPLENQQSTTIKKIKSRNTKLTLPSIYTSNLDISKPILTSSQCPST